ncbi:tetratricopeptide repeat protein [bacterium]|nr:tetratricopeptide repeat protein [bacterium]
MRKLIVVLSLAVVWMFTVASSPVVTGAKVRIKAKKYDEAIKVLEDSKAEYPNDPELYYYLGRAYAGTAKWAPAGDNFSKALTLNPDKELKKEIEKWRDFHWSSFVKEGSALLQQKRYDIAIDKYVLANKINPDRKESWANLGVAQLESGRAFDEAQPPKPDSAKILYEGSIDSFKKALELDPTNETFIKNLAQAYTIAGKEDEAIGIYEKCLENNPDDSQIKERLVTLYMTRQDFEAAARIFDTMLSDAGAELGAADYFNAASCYYQIYMGLSKKEDQASKDKAAEFLHKAAGAYTSVLEETPNDCEAATQLYYTYINLENWPKVIETIEGMMKNGCQRDYPTLQNLGVAYVKVGNKEKGVEVFKEAEALKASDAGKK